MSKLCKNHANPITRFLFMRQSLIFVPNFFGIWIQSCTKLVGTHALLIIITFIIKMYVFIMTCMIQYPCSKHASSPSLPHQAMLVYTCLSFIPSALSLTTLILGSGEQSFYTKCPKSFVQDCSLGNQSHVLLIHMS